jgi:hypothetical protein
MPSDAAPSLYTIAFELGVYAVALVVLGVLWRSGRKRDIALMLTAMVFAGALEISDIRTTHSYYYARFLVMIGDEPNWFPLAIAVAWGLVLHTVMSCTARLPLGIASRALIAAPLGTLVDFVLDPVVASARIVTTIGEVCDRFDAPHGSAVGLGLWVWCVPADDPNQIWGIPFANFYAWGVVIFGYAAVAAVLQEAFADEDEGEGKRFDFGLAIVTAVAAFCLVAVALQLYTPIVMHGVPEWSLLALVFGPGLVLLARAGLVRDEAKILLATWLFPPAALLYCAGAYLISGIAGHAGTGMLVYVALATLACLCAHAFILLGGNFFWQLLGQFRPAARRGPQPTRAELLASGPERVSQQDLAAVAALRDPVLRNYMITQRYHDLSVELARLIAGPNANWCTFATWASGTAGESIRDEEVPAVVVDILRGEEQLERMLGELGRALGDTPPDLSPLDIFDLARDTLARVRSQVADGNRKVFAELAPAFATFVACFGPDGAIDRAALDRFLATLRPGASDRDGQELLRQAFPAYAAASQEQEPSRRAQWMLLGNCLIGLHEQTRLQPNIAAAMDAPVDVTASDGPLARIVGLMPSDIRREFERLFGPASKVTVGVARAIWQRIATAAAMHISLPNGQRIPLGQDVDVSLGRSFPAELRAPDLAQLRALLDRFKADHAEPFGLGALDWASLDDRMRFIIDLFRTTQQEVRLFEQPFAPVFRLELDARFAAATAPAQAAAESKAVVG